ncbi:MAG: hypothetical protein GTO64_07875 [Candidatus Latescibacteria bacterium]|nr:hypothetical protein [Candidatus Latescibacterota bacterium]
MKMSRGGDTVWLSKTGHEGDSAYLSFREHCLIPLMMHQERPLGGERPAWAGMRSTQEESILVKSLIRTDEPVG